MKTKKLSGLLATLVIACTLSISFISCSKSQKLAGADDDLDQPALQQTASAVGGNNNNPVSFCSPDSVPLCWKNSQQDLSWVKVKRGSDQNTYVTFTATNKFYFMQINLYCGPATGLPNQLAAFPFKITFDNPYPNDTYTFVIPNLPESFIVAGYAKVIHKASNGNLTGNIKEGWANKCAGQDICSLLSGSCGDLAGGSYFDYSSAGCFPAPPPPPAILSSSTTEPNTCSKAIDHFFGIDPAYGVELSWAVPDVTVAGYTYTEAESRDLAKIAGNPDSKYAMMRVATLKLSNTNYTASPTLAPAVITIENWLSTTGKLTAANLPTGNVQVKNAADVIDTWIAGHLCPERR